MSKHTPLPWKVYRTTDGQMILGIGDADAGGITDSHFSLWLDGAEQEANAAFIVTACNNHDALVGMLEEAVCIMTGAGSWHTVRFDNERMETVERARALLAALGAA